MLMRGGAEGRARSIKEGSLRYRRDFHDTKLWDKLARDRNIKLPMWHIGPTAVKMRKWLIKLGITETEYFDWFGGKVLMEFSRDNNKWPLRAWVGLLLEYLESRPREIDNAEEKC